MPEEGGGDLVFLAKNQRSVTERVFAAGEVCREPYSVRKVILSAQGLVRHGAE